MILLHAALAIVLLSGGDDQPDTLRLHPQADEDDGPVAGQPGNPLPPAVVKPGKLGSPDSSSKPGTAKPPAPDQDPVVAARTLVRSLRQRAIDRRVELQRADEDLRRAEALLESLEGNRPADHMGAPARPPRAEGVSSRQAVAAAAEVASLERLVAEIRSLAGSPPALAEYQRRLEAARQLAGELRASPSREPRSARE